MSARDEIYEGLEGHACCYTAEEATALLDRHRNEVRAEAAARIRAAYSGDGPDEDNWIRTPYDAADLIDPEENR